MFENTVNKLHRLGINRTSTQHPTNPGDPSECEPDGDNSGHLLSWRASLETFQSAELTHSMLSGRSGIKLKKKNTKNLKNPHMFVN